VNSVDAADAVSHGTNGKDVKCCDVASKWSSKWNIIEVLMMSELRWLGKWMAAAADNPSQSWSVTLQALRTASRASLLVSLEPFYVMAVFTFSLLLLILFPPCTSSLILLPLHMILLLFVWSWALPSQPPMLLSAYLVGCCIRLGAAIAAAGTRLWIRA